jgi:hypothetical protein
MRPVLATAARRALLTRYGVLTCADVLVARPVQALATLGSGTGAVPEPDRARAQHAPQLAAARQVRAIARPEREVLGLAGQVAGRMRAGWVQRGPGGRGREAVVWIWPRRRLPRVSARTVEPVRQQGKLVAAALPDRRERNRVPGQGQGDLIRLACPVTACDRCHGQD